MLVLFESPAGYAIFKLADEKKLRETENLFLDFETPEQASKVVKLKHFEKFNDMTDALSAATAVVEGKMTKRLKKLLKKVVIKDTQDQLAVADAKLGNIIKEKLQISCVSSTAVQELMRCIRSQMDSLISGLPGKEMAAMALGLAHSLSRYKLKFSPDKVDTMIIQAVSLLDDLDKELNNYIMRCKEWYGWHFPELSKIIADNIVYVKTVQKMGLRTNAAECDLSDILSEDIDQKVKEVSEISMGTEISEEDMQNINHLCNEIIEMQAYRSQLYEYLKNRMMAVAPNLTVLVGDLVGARLISHAGSLLSLAKHPASTVQILGAEKALFRALKTKHDTPKYGLIYHAQLVGQTNPKLKGKISRMLAAKAALACRVDALGEDTGFQLGAEHKCKVESRMKLLEEGGMRRVSGTGKKLAKWDKYENKSEVFEYKVAQDSTLPSSTNKRKLEDEDDTFLSSKKVKMEIKEEVEEDLQGADDANLSKSEKRKKKQKHLTEEVGEMETTLEENEPSASKKKKKKQKLLEESIKTELEDESFGADQSLLLAGSEKKKKKKKRDSDTSKTEQEPLNYDTAGAEAFLPFTGSPKKKKQVETPVKTTEDEQSYESSTSKKKKKKQKLLEESMKMEDESFGTDLSQSLIGSEKKKKKKKQDSDTVAKTEQEGLNYDIDADPSTSFTESGKKKKKKRKLETP